MGCSRENNDICRDIIEETSTLVSEEDAIVALQSFLSGFEPESKSGKHRVIKNVYSIGGPSATKSIDAVEEPLVYVVNYENGTLKSTSEEYEHLVHCNFGWDGVRNGFYYSGQFDTNAGPETKSAPMDSEGTRYYYQYNLKMNSDIYL